MADTLTVIPITSATAEPQNSLHAGLQPLKEIPPDLIRLASFLAMEIRTPLTDINLSIEVLDTSINTPGHKVYLDIIKRSSIRINDLLNELIKGQLEKNSST
jgi:signal transduction histidine kinase